MSSFLRVYAPMEPQDTSYIESVKNMTELFVEVKKKYDETVCKWLRLSVMYEGESARKKYEKIAVDDLAAELPNTTTVLSNNADH
jgi:hypothetical protein